MRRLLAVLVLLAPFARAEVLVVDSFGGPYVQIFDAIADASPGDTILVRTGGYIGFEVDGASVAIVADKDAVVTIDGMIEIRNLAAGQAALLHGLLVQPGTSGAGIRVTNCAGPVWIEDTSVGQSYLTTVPVPAVLVNASASVALQRCDLLGSRALGTTPGGHGVSATNSTVHLLETTSTGGEGSSTGTAGAGVRLSGGTLFASGGAIVGGEGALGGGLPSCSDGGDGGIGLQLVGAAPTATLRDVDVAGGAAGGATEPCLPGADGPAIDAPAGAVTTSPFTARALVVDGPLRSGETFLAALTGVPGDVAFLVASAIQAPTVFPAGGALAGGPLFPSLASYVLVPLGVVDISGTLQLAAAVPALPVALTYYMQGAMIAPAPAAGTIVFSSAQAVTLLPAGL